MISETSSPLATASARNGLEAAFEKHLASQSGAPAWWLDMKRDAFAAYDRLPMPTRRNEQWRFSSMRGLDLSGYDLSTTSTAADASALLATPALVSRRSGRMVFADDSLLAHEPASAELSAKGVIWEPLSEALVRHRDLLQEYFMAQDPKLGSEKFAALHSAFVSTGSLLFVPAGVEVDLPFVTRHWASTEGVAVFPHTLVIAGENARVTLVDLFASATPAQKNFACGFNHLFAGKGARIDYYSLQNWSTGTLGFQINSLVAGKDAKINSLAVNVGCSHFRSESQSILEGEGSDVEMFSLSVTDGDQEVDQRTLQSHLAPNARSNLLFKNALVDQSRTIFSGMIRVAEDAQKTDAYQSNRNLLLSGTAEANSLPGLEIHANDVRCTHGATTSQIDDNELFYLLARGIQRKTAQELLAFGFFEEIIGHIENDEMAAGVRDLLQSKFRADVGRVD
ncbi:Fe-S cluster assembly protein SufD [Opitutales bacterium ASA1]|uniref:Fe-S cluster assembly protein SufD n=1 Tax=Congregicoccus parvus TaxID=3081749 RepID=UPI002B2B94AB|nr:Fe-S cluster assembly protein SufD [Opitutales bacterium ASA1]